MSKELKIKNSTAEFLIFTSNSGENAIKVKYREKIKKKYLKGLDFFDKKFKTDKKVIISKNVSDNIGNTKILSLWKLDKL